MIKAEWIPAFIFIVAVLALAIAFGFYRGEISRFWTTVGQDPVTKKDLIYQTNGIRVYRFTDEGNTCYLADDDGVALFCLKKD